MVTKYTLNLDGHPPEKTAEDASQSNDGSTAALFEDILARNLILEIKVTGQSMYPTIQSGDVVCVRKVPPAELPKGSIILTKDAFGSLLLHRLIRKNHPKLPDHMQTKGDALSRLDQPVSHNNILGQVITQKRASPPRQFSRNMLSFHWKLFNWLNAFNQSIIIIMRKIFLHWF